MEVITNGWAFMLYCGWVVFHVCGGEPSSLNHSSNDRHAVSNAWLLWIVLQYPCQGRCLLDSMPSFPLGVRPGRPLDRTTFLVLIFFFFLRKFCTISHCSSTDLHSCQQGARAPFALHSCQNWLCLINSLSHGSERISHADFDLHVPDDSFYWIFPWDCWLLIWEISVVRPTANI